MSFYIANCSHEIVLVAFYNIAHNYTLMGLAKRLL